MINNKELVEQRVKELEDINILKFKYNNSRKKITLLQDNIKSTKLNIYNSIKTREDAGAKDKILLNSLIKGYNVTLKDFRNSVKSEVKICAELKKELHNSYKSYQNKYF